MSDSATSPHENQATTIKEAMMDDERIRELREAVAKVKRLDEAVELGWWDDWSVVLAEGVEKLLPIAEAAYDYLAAMNTLALRPTKEVETAAAQAHHDLTEALRALD